jgi:starch-binding outer membrane protein, SusD/RagB family
MLHCNKIEMKLKRIFILPALILGLSSCEKILDKNELTAFNEELIFSDSVLARNYIDLIYEQNAPLWGGTWDQGTTANISDEGSGDNKYFLGTLTNTDVGDFGTRLDANSNWGKIRTINDLISKVYNGSLSKSWSDKLAGQAYFFRAWRYFELVKLYGGVPLVLTPLKGVGDAAKDEARMPRNKTSECIAQIVKDLDMAQSLLPGKWVDGPNDWGRVTSGAAAALKGRVLLHWASPMFNPSNSQDRWEAAYEANKEAKKILNDNGFRLNTSFDGLWFQEVNNPEAVFVTGYNTSQGDQQRKTNGYDNATRPAYLGTNGGSNRPTKELVDAFPMLDGKKPNESTKYTYNSQLFYKNRDPRFNKTIGYNGGLYPALGNSNYRLWTFLNTNNSSVETSKPTNTGFYLKKAINPTVAVSDVQWSGTDWIEIRYAEVLLNLAEAAAMSGNPDDAFAALREIRSRAGIEAGTDGNYGLDVSLRDGALAEAVLYERQIELAWEGKRFWDLRRWKLFESLLVG